ncbi:MAG: phospho-sugar mutase, partial [Proteiniphilum sp.]|nr:phospho-sugar mutase [Proteiniphilum sp.]
GGSPVVLIKDFAKLEAVDFVRNENVALEMPTTSNVIQYFTEEATKLSIRPSGTEPKIKFYIEVKGKVKSREDIKQAEYAASKKINTIREELGI